MTEDKDLIIDLGRHKVSFKWIEDNKFHVFQDAEGYYLDYATQYVSKRFDRLHENEKPISGIKRCRRCKEIKIFDDFGNDRNLRSGRQAICRSCSTIKHRDYLRANPGFKGKSERAKVTERLRKHRRRKTPLNRLRHQMRKTIKRHLNELRGKNLYVNILGCRSHEFIQYLESQFDERMNWDNRSIDGWHMDHIIPISAFDISNKLHVKWCWNYRNTQPMWGKDNENKSDRLPTGDSVQQLRATNVERLHDTIGSELSRLGIATKEEYIESLKVKSKVSGEIF